METLQILIQQMIADISFEIARLDRVRLCMFLRWLRAHSSRFSAAEPIEITNWQGVDAHLKNELGRWLAALPIDWLPAEYHLIRTELAWWCQVEDRILLKLLVYVLKT